MNNEWISVDDMYKPDDAEWYLVYQGNNRFCRMMINGEWFNAKEDKYGKVTHWMELPPPPKD